MLFQHSPNVIISSSEILKQLSGIQHERRRVRGNAHQGARTAHTQIPSSEHELEGVHPLSRGSLKRFRLELGRAHGLSMG